ncbi:hypothetical protein KSP39_PZI017975 [Platanthera zijinensis]|uniref:Transmembrane protein n=1 Tax=Platanthera zijinensis TaxID=2320716 RepID=A0AAP0FZI6_9ASPA
MFIVKTDRDREKEIDPGSLVFHKIFLTCNFIFFLDSSMLLLHQYFSPLLLYSSSLYSSFFRR